MSQRGGKPAWDPLAAWARGAAPRPGPCACGQLPDMRAGFSGWAVECPVCGAKTGGWDDPDDAIREWNRKAKNGKGGDKHGEN